MFTDAKTIISELADIVRPPRRLTVPQAAEKHVMLDVPGGYSGPYKNELVYYLIEPAECLTSRDYNAVIFVAPAQTAKTSMLVDNWIAHTITCDPSDHLVIQTSQDIARDYSKRRIDRLINASPALKQRIKPGGQNDNTYDKFFKSGMILSLGWPTKNQLAGKAIGKMALTDYDRMPDDIDGEGPAFNLSQKRTTTFLSRGMTLAESSPSKSIIDPKYKIQGHEAPPTKGILGLYNNGDRRRIYGQCPHCDNYFSPSANIQESFYIPNDLDFTKAGLTCIKCGSIIGLEYEKVFKKSGKWLKEGQTITPNGAIHGVGRSNSVASFWLPGWFAAFQSWQSIINNYLSALEHFERTGDEEPLKATYNLDQGAPYLPKALENARDPDILEQRAEVIKKRTVPDGVKFLLASIDVQKGRFVVQVEGFGEHLESWLIDRFNIRISYRDNEQGNPLPLDPAAYFEDWDTITNNVINKTYEKADGSGEMPITKTVCDSGGQQGVTDNAYRYWRKLARLGIAHRDSNRSKFILIKGNATKTAPLIRETFPDTTRRHNRVVKARGDVPVYLLNTDLFKDMVSNDIERKEPGPRFVHFPDWLGSWFYAELTAETRTTKGWVKSNQHKRNEAFDLMCYTRAIIKLIKADLINWDRPPRFAGDKEPDKPTSKQENYTDQMLRENRKQITIGRHNSGGFVKGWKK